MQITIDKPGYLLGMRIGDYEIISLKFSATETSGTITSPAGSTPSRTSSAARRPSSRTPSSEHGGSPAAT